MEVGAFRVLMNYFTRPCCGRQMMLWKRNDLQEPVADATFPPLISRAAPASTACRNSPGVNVNYTLFQPGALSTTRFSSSRRLFVRDILWKVWRIEFNLVYVTRCWMHKCYELRRELSRTCWLTTNTWIVANMKGRRIHGARGERGRSSCVCFQASGARCRDSNAAGPHK